ncbi:MAG: hypothetical protein EAZ89_21030, partial [Bacteroidetes bacterium]
MKRILPLLFILPLSLAAQTEPASADVEVQAFITDFCATLDALSTDFGQNFSRSLGPVNGSPGDNGNIYTCLFPLPAASDTYFMDERQGKRRSLVAVFEQSPDLATARKMYDALVNLINNCPLTCCNLVHEEAVYENITTTFWLPLDLSGTMDPAFDRMLLE